MSNGGIKDNITKIGDKVVRILRWLNILVLTFVVLHVGRRVFIVERFSIPTASMSPTINPGDHVFVNKLLLGARIFTYSKFKTRSSLKSLRMPGIRTIKANDVICFNHPHGYNDNRIEFNMNKVYCKRVLGTPGDRIGAVDGHYWNDKLLKPIGIIEEQNKLRWMFDSIFVWCNNYEVIPYVRSDWNIKNWGPIVVPGKGQTISLDLYSRKLYEQIIEYETGMPINDNLSFYTFTENYYFAVGDNVIDSDDSRYWGFIPEDFIIGIVAGKKVRNNPNQSN